jgi:hypothetical protein
LDGFSCLIGTGIAHVIMSEAGLYDINSGFLADVFRRNNAGISLEDGILGTERISCRDVVNIKMR